MPTPNLKSDGAKQKQQEQEILDTLFNQVYDRVGVKLSQKEAKVNIETFIQEHSRVNQKLSKGQISHKQVQIEVLTDFLQNPAQMEGKVQIWVDNKIVLVVQNGEIIRDDLHIAADLIMEGMNLNFPPKPGQNTLNAIRHMLYAFGEKTLKGGLYYKGRNYVYSESNGQIQVCTSLESRMVLNNDGFTSQATKEDKEVMLGFEKVFRELDIDSPIVPSVKPKL